MAAALHIHPNNPHSVITGRRLQPGERVQREDVYSDPETRTWEPVPIFIVGHVVQEGQRRIIVRPEE